MPDLTRAEIDVLITCRPEYGVAADDFARAIAAIIADYTTDRTMQTLHLIRYRFYLEHRQRSHKLSA